MATTTRKLADLTQFVANDSTIGTGGIAALDTANATSTKNTKIHATSIGWK